MAAPIPVYLVHGNDWSLPVSLGAIQSHVQRYAGGSLAREIAFEALSSPSPQLAAGKPPGIWLFADYLWSVELNFAVSRAVALASPRSVRVHGGASVPKHAAPCDAFLRAEPHVDVAVRGEGEVTAAELIAHLVHAFRSGTPWREGITDIAGVSHRPRGDGETRVRGEIAWIADHRIPVLFIADANFGILERDVEIAECIAAQRARTGFPREVIVSYAKDGGPRAAEIVRTLVSAGVVAEGVSSIQSRDPQVLDAVRRTNIRTASYEKLVDAYRREDLPVTTDLMVGLPGSTLASHKADLQWCLDEDLVARCFPTVVLANSPLADPDYLAAHAIRTHPGGVIVANATLPADDMAEVWRIVRLYEIAEKATLLRYVMRHLQWAHGLPASELLHSLVREMREEPDRFPVYLHALDRNACLAGVVADPNAFYGAVWRHVREVHGIALDGESDRAIWQLNAAVVPRRGARYPLEIESPWDVVGYFASCVAPRAGEVRKLVPADPMQSFQIADDEGRESVDFEKGAVAVSSGLRMFELDWPGRQRAMVAAMRGPAAHAWRSVPAVPRPRRDA